jgi:hypothetical protein
VNRFLLIFLVWIFTAGCGWFVLSGSPPAPAPRPDLHPAPAFRTLRLEITSSFDMAADPFALNPSQDSGLQIYENGVLQKSLSELKAEDTPLFLESRIAAASVEYRIRASAGEPPLRPQALRVRVFENGLLRKDLSGWSQDGLLDLHFHHSFGSEAEHGF